MAMPGSNKGLHLQYKGKPFGLMLLLALSATMFGVMVVHKLREKRALSILVKEKDIELYELQTLLQVHLRGKISQSLLVLMFFLPLLYFGFMQKERNQAQEIRGKTQEMKDMMYTLSSQKRDLDVRIMEMESTISSLKDDHQAMAMTLEDRANEIKTLREKEMDISKKESEEASLREIVRLKEAEIEDLTRRLDSSMQASNAHQQDNMASPVNAGESNVADGGNSEGGTKLEGEKIKLK